MYDLFKEAKVMLFRAAETEGTAECLGLNNRADIIFKRTAEFQLELLESIESILGNGKIRPAYSLIRTSLEVCTGFAWLAEDFNGRSDRYIQGRLPSIQKMMSKPNLGWKSEYEKVYSPLSDFVHGSYIKADFNKEIKSNEKAISLTGLDMFFNEVDNKITFVGDIPKEELISKHSSFIELKVFDIVLTFLTRASGDYSDAFNWWPKVQVIEYFSKVIDRSEGDVFLWNQEKIRLAICRVEGRYK